MLVSVELSQRCLRNVLVSRLHLRAENGIHTLALPLIEGMDTGARRLAGGGYGLDVALDVVLPLFLEAKVLGIHYAGESLNRFSSRGLVRWWSS